LANWGAIKAEEWRMRQQPPTLNKTLSHSNGKVVFDHGPKQADTKN